MKPTCPNCQSPDVTWRKKKQCYICEDCDHEFVSEKQFEKLRIFLSYGHDRNEELVLQIKKDLEKRGHDVWFDKSDIKVGQDWRRSITDGIHNSEKVLSFLSKHSTREPGVCLDEIAIAIGDKGGNIQTILVEGEDEVKAPATISHIQWLDMHDWQEVKTKGAEDWNAWYKNKFNEIVEVVESEESRTFAGEIEELKGYLNPISSYARIKQLLQKGFIGREWINEAVEKWRKENRESRMFWLMGNPGVGKSAFAANLSHFGKDKVIAAQFVEYDKPDHRNATRVIRSLAFQLATRLSSYRRLLLKLPEIKNLDPKGEAELFEYLLAEPLKHGIDDGQERYLMIIDALDEAKEEERNPLVEMLARHAPRLPDWLGIVVTSRNEKNVTDPLQGLKPFVLDTENEANQNDIRTYIELELEEQLQNFTNKQNIVAQILEKSEGVFLYVERVCRDLQVGNLSLENQDAFPVGLGGIYWQFFQRQFQDSEKYKKNIRPVLRLIMAAMEPLPVHLLKDLMNWGREEMNDFSRSLGSLFPVVDENNVNVIKPYHKSIIDWISQESTAGQYFVSTEEGQKSLMDYGWNQYKTGAENLDLYFIKWLPRHLTLLENWEEVTELLCDLDFIQAKAVAKLTYDLVRDFYFALNGLPQYQPEKENERKRQERLEKYTQDLIACAEGKISRFDLEVPESITPWTEEQINDDVERIKTNPNQADKLKDFKVFLGCEAGNLQNYAYEFKHFATQQAWNYADEGPVGIEAQKRSLEVYNHLLLKIPSTRPKWNSMPQAVQIMLDHTGQVNDIAICPDGKRAISGSSDKTCILWDLESGQSIQTLQGHVSQVSAVALSPDGKRAFSGSWDKTCILWDIESGQPIKILQEHTGQVTAVALSPDGKRAVSGSYDKTCILWDLESGQAVKTLQGHTSQVTAVALSPDGKWAVSGSWDKTCILWNLENGQPVQTLLQHTSPVNAVALSPDGKQAISGTWDNTCILWNLISGQPVKTPQGHSKEVNTIVQSPAGNWAISGSEDTTCILWDLESGRVVQSLQGHTNRVTAVALSPDGKRAISGSGDNNCILWDLESGQAVQILKGHAGQVNSIALSPDGKRAISGSDDNNCILWELESGQAVQILKGHAGQVNSIALSPDGKRAISGSDDNTCIIWDLVGEQAAQTLKGHTGQVNSIALSPDGKRAVSGSDDNTCIIWDLLGGQAVHTLKGHTGQVNTLALSPDGKRAISGSDDNTCIIWDIESRQAVQTLKGHSMEVYAVVLSPDGKRAISGSYDKTCILWDMESSQKLALFKTESFIGAVDFLAKRILLGGEVGVPNILQGNRALLCPDKGVVSTVKIWDFGFKRFLPSTADCPFCGNRFSPPKSVLNNIDRSTKNVGLLLEQSPCLELPDEAWQDPGLLSECPNCGEKLKFNPFIAGGD